MTLPPLPPLLQAFENELLNGQPGAIQPREGGLFGAPPLPPRHILPPDLPDGMSAVVIARGQIRVDLYGEIFGNRASAIIEKDQFTAMLKALAKVSTQA